MKYIKALLYTILSISIFGCGNTSTTQREADNTPEINIPIRVACVGDSITQGVGISNPVKNSYPVKLAEKLGSGWEVRNYGKSGATLTQTGDRPYTNTEHYIPSRDFNPNIIVIMLGSNDIKPENIGEIHRYIADYNTLIASYKNLPSNPKIYLCTPPPSYGSFAGITDKNIRHELLPRIQNISEKNNLEIIDIYSVLSNKKSLFPDTLHPNNKGAVIIAETIYNTIK